MNLSVNISLLILALIQLSYATEDITKDKRYPLYDVISTQAYNCELNLLLDYGRVFVDEWAEYNKIVTDSERKSQDYQELTLNINHIIEAFENFEKNQNNCELHNEMRKQIQTFLQSDSAEKWQTSEAVRKRVEEINAAQKLKIIKVLYKIFAELRMTIDSFTQSLDENERELYKHLLDTCQLFVNAKDNAEKYYHMTDIADVFYKNDNFKSDCKMKYLEEFIMQTVATLL